mgnify:CR=1 FL=1|jgi:hypothetical protein
MDEFQSKVELTIEKMLGKADEIDESYTLPAGMLLLLVSKNVAVALRISQGYIPIIQLA